MDPKPVDPETAIQLFLVGTMTGMVVHGDNIEEVRRVVKQLNVELLQAYIDSKPEGFLYAEQVQEAIRIAKTLKSFARKQGKGPSEPPAPGQ
jgi:phosphoribosylanthranilate isomerase